MKTTAALIAVSLVLLTLNGCTRPAPAPTSGGPEARQLAARLDGLETAVDALADRLGSLETQAAATTRTQVTQPAPTSGAAAVVPPPPAPLPEEALESLAGRLTKIIEARVDAAVAEQLGDQQDMQAVITGMVQDEVQKQDMQRAAERTQAAEQRRQEWQERRERREEERIEELATELGLDDNQKEQMRTASADMQNAMRDAVAQIREQGGGFQGMRDTYAKIREEHDQKLSEILTPEQLEAYKKQPRSSFSLGGGSRRGGGDREPPPQVDVFVQ